MISPSPFSTDARSGVLGAAAPQHRRPRNRLLAALPVAERVRLERFLERVPMPQYLPLAKSGDPLDFVWFPDTGVGSAVVATPDGDCVEAGLMGAEALIGIEALHGDRRSELTVLVQIPGYGARMRAADFRREVVAPRRPLFRLAMRFAAAFQVAVAQVAACNARHDAGNRLARWLLMARDRVTGDELRLTHEFLAQMVGTRRATVTHAANELRGAGAIDYHRGRILITGRARLEAMACGCYALIRREMEAVFCEPAPACRADGAPQAKELEEVLP